MQTSFPASAPAANPVFFRTYSRSKTEGRESWAAVVQRTIDGISELGNLTEEESALLEAMQTELKVLPSGRWLWVGGTKWILKPSNFSGAYNCTSTNLVDWEAFGLMMDLAMMGSGTGAIIEQQHVEKLPAIVNKLNVEIIRGIGQVPADRRQNGSMVSVRELVTGEHLAVVSVGDSRRGWVDAYQALLQLASDQALHGGEVQVQVDLGHVRPAGERLHGFGGVSNPIKLPDLFPRVAQILNKAQGRQLTSIECCLLIDEAALVVVAGNVRRSAGMRQFSAFDSDAAAAKDNLWQQDETGAWVMDPERDALRMANHTRVFHQRPSYSDVLEAVTKQFYSGEGAIQFAPEAIARANADILTNDSAHRWFVSVYCTTGKEAAGDYLKMRRPGMSDAELAHRLGRYGLNPCLTGDTKVLTVHEGPVSFRELAERGEDVLVWSVDPKTNKPGVKMMRNPRITGYDMPVVEVEFDSGLKVRATHDHNFFTLQRNKVKAKDLKPGQSVSAFAIHQHRDGQLRVLRSQKPSHQAKQWFCHRLIAEHYGISGGVIHHKDHDPTNNRPENLQATDASEHNRAHWENRVRRGFFHGKPGPKARKVLEEVVNHKVVAVREVGKETVYNGTVDDFHTYVVVDPSPVGKSYMSGILSANCGEIIGSDFHCNLSEVHLNQLDPEDLEAQDTAFKAAALAVASLLHHRFEVERYRISRELDPIVGVSFTGLFDFFVKAFGTPWLEWWAAGRPSNDEGETFKALEAIFLFRWKQVVHRTVAEYCYRHDLKVPNRCTTVQPAGTKSLLTGASPGWHPPKAQRFIRRVTFGKNDPVALACLDYGYTVVPGQGDKDEQGRLLDDPFDPRCTEWLVEIPTEVSWANIPGADAIDINGFSALAQFDFYMQVQRYYTAHNTSATIEYREHEIEPLARRIHQAIEGDEGYISAALLARFDANETFPRLPFEPIDRQTYERLHEAVLARRKTDDFLAAIRAYDQGPRMEAGPAGCDSDKCLLPLAKPAEVAA